LATDPVPANRPTIRELLDYLDNALEALTAPSADNDAEPPPAVADDPPTVATVDPLAAHQGDILDGGWRVLRRLGSGSTAVALLCTRPGAAAPEVLKVAKDEDHAERLRDEARTLGDLRDSGIVELFGVDRIGGRTVLRLAPAGDPEDRQGLTLADRLIAQGRLGLDLLDRFGDDLLAVIGFLESEGVAHRDVKPDNLGVRPRRGDRSLHLVLFDFSLSRTPDTALSAGTVGYLDPFLAERPDRRWDPAADRYAAAATLHEMATGSRPVWGDGRTDPLHLPDETPRLDP
jgi:serine/threonine protein kinase